MIISGVKECDGKNILPASDSSVHRASDLRIKTSIKKGYDLHHEIYIGQGRSSFCLWSYLTLSKSIEYFWGRV